MSSIHYNQESGIGRTLSLPAKSTQWNLLVIVTQSPSPVIAPESVSSSSFSGAGLLALLLLKELEGRGSRRLSPALGVEGLEPGVGLLTLPVLFSAPALCRCESRLGVDERLLNVLVFEDGGECWSTFGEPGPVYLR